MSARANSPTEITGFSKGGGQVVMSHLQYHMAGQTTIDLGCDLCFSRQSAITWCFSSATGKADDVWHHAVVGSPAVHRHKGHRRLREKWQPLCGVELMHVAVGWEVWRRGHRNSNTCRGGRQRWPSSRGANVGTDCGRALICWQLTASQGPACSFPRVLVRTNILG